MKHSTLLLYQNHHVTFYQLNSGNTQSNLCRQLLPYVREDQQGNKDITQKDTSCLSCWSSLISPVTLKSRHRRGPGSGLVGQTCSVRNVKLRHGQRTGADKDGKQRPSDRRWAKWQTGRQQHTPAGIRARATHTLTYHHHSYPLKVPGSQYILEDMVFIMAVLPGALFRVLVDRLEWNFLFISQSKSNVIFRQCGCWVLYIVLTRSYEDFDYLEGPASALISFVDTHLCLYLHTSYTIS